MHKLMIVSLALLLLAACAPQTSTIRGEFIVTKACMGSVDGHLLPEFANRCEEALELEGREVEIRGVVEDRSSCPPDEQCALGLYMTRIESIQTFDVRNVEVYCCNRCMAPASLELPIDCTEAEQLSECAEFFKTNSCSNI